MDQFADIQFKWTFRNYQQDVLDNAQKHLKDGRIHIVAAPGSGKTVLGLELICRQKKPALVLSPSVTIRQQWGERFAECYLPDGEQTEKYVSYSLKQPKLITSVTYQALHAAFTKTAVEEEADDDSFDSEEAQDFSEFELLDAVKKAGIATVCLDEAHHLKSEWQKALEKFILLLGNEVCVIALTATPPYDSTPQEWARYTTLCGEIDEEIFVPQLVAQKTLCPHQDFIYFNYPTEKETQTLSAYKEKAKQCTEVILQSGVLANALQASGVGTASEQAQETLYDHLSDFAALVCAVKHSGTAVSPSLEKLVFEGKKPPVYSIKTAEKAFQFIIDNPDIFTQEISDALRENLSREALIEKRKVQLCSTDKIDRMLLASTGKLESINKIVESEIACAGEELRMLILTDFIKKDMMKLVGTQEEIHALGTVPVFESIRRAHGENTKIALLSGNLVILPVRAVSAAVAVAARENVSCSVRAIGETSHKEVIFGGSNKNKVKIITEIFQQGEINILVGTKSLLGEGWDSPNINSLILASFVGSFMLSNQMRGRAIRIDKNKPEKVSNIWHLATVDPTDEQADANTVPGNDFATMQRRFACFQAPAYSSDTIESGMDRLDIIRPPFNAEGIARINEQMLTLASDRTNTVNRWNGTVKNNARTEIEEVSEIPATVQPAQAVYKNKIYTVILAVVLVLALIVTFTAGVLGGIIGIVIAALAGFAMVKTVSVVTKNASPEKTVRTLANCVLRALKQTGAVESDRAGVRITKSAKGDSIFCSLSNASAREKKVFADAVSQMLSPIDDPRYLLIATKQPGNAAKRNYVQSFACPAVLAANKETAAVLAQQLRQSGSKFELVFTRNEAGRKELFQCRKYSYINANGKTVKNKKTVV